MLSDLDLLNVQNRHRTFTKEEYEELPVYYCKRCLSLGIKNIRHLEDSDYCNDCGSTNIEQTSIQNWNEKYIEMYGHSYLDKY